ncbi:MAG: 4-(cytidine 5'-diphospho)-2-C-methyl-D-erythritol kinase [Tannerellaceae bacterium]|nr:4-(cytidine 5'-diphospho)-2-C-methyl-D-erythritol kinase [Tannerellaceae bacterium]
MINFPNAKINLGLNIVSKRPDGYHNIETIFYPVPLCDALEAIAADKFTFSQTGIAVDSEPEKNLVVKALRLLQQEYDFPQVEVHLLKAIPFGAGLGGGSADAAYMLKLINDLFELNIKPEKLEKLAGQLGADCPFFIRNKPVFASGTGNIFEPVDLSLTGYHICLIKPDIKVSTPEAYSMITPGTPVHSIKDIVKLPVEEWKDKLINDFEAVVFRKHPEIKQIKEQLYDAGAVYACMSGSGSSVFGLFKEAPGDLQQIVPHCFVWSGELS